MRKLILHLCADIGSDSRFYSLDPNYEVVMIGKEIGVENYKPPKNVHGIIANPVCTEFSTSKGFHKLNDLEKGNFLVSHCLRIIRQSQPNWWVLENPANGRLKDVLGEPEAVYHPWHFGSPWTKKTALWGNFTMPKRLYNRWEEVPKIKELYIRPGRRKPSLAFFHKSALQYIEEFKFAEGKIHCDTDLRSLCSQGFAREFYRANP